MLKNDICSPLFLITKPLDTVKDSSPTREENSSSKEKSLKIFFLIALVLAFKTALETTSPFLLPLVLLPQEGKAIRDIKGIISSLFFIPINILY